MRPRAKQALDTLVLNCDNQTMESNPSNPQDPILHDHERRLARLEEARRSLEDTAVVVSRIQSDTSRSLAELKELTELHTRWLVDLDRKLDRIAELILKGQSGNGHP
jgi:hypothetical protein